MAALLEAERRQLPLFLPVALALGILLWFLLPWNGERQAALLLLLAVALSGTALSGTLRRIVVVGALLAALGLTLADVRSARVAAPRLYHWLSAAPLAGTVEAVRPQAGGERWTILLRRDASDIDPAITVRLSYAGALAAEVAPGARIRVRATLGPIASPALPGASDPARRAWFDSVSASGRMLDPPEILQPSRAGPGRFAALRQRLGARIAAALPGDAGAIAGALVVGEQGRIRPELVEAMRVAGLAHILTVSGFHIGLVVAGSFFLLRHLLALWPWLALRCSVRVLAALGGGVMGTLYTLLSGSGLPAIRSLVAAWVVLLAMMLGRDPLAPRLIAFAAFLILALRPESLLNPSFQLSFAAVTALVALAHSGLGRSVLPRGDDSWPRKLLKFVTGLFLTGLVAELVLGPIALAQFGRAGAYGAIANLAAVPLTSFVIMPLLALWLLLLPLQLGAPVSWALDLALRALGGIGFRVAQWPGASITLPAMPETALFTLFAGALLLLLLYGRLRLLGVPVLAAGILLAVLAPRPDLFVSADGRQVAVIAEDTLYTLRGHRGGFLVRNWAEQADAEPSARLADLPGAICNTLACRVPLAGGRVLLALFDAPPADGQLERSCAGVDVVTSPGPLPLLCRPRWLRLEPASLLPLGAMAIDSGRGRLDSVGGRAGDQPWSVAARPGMRPRLFGSPVFVGVVVE